MSSGQPSSTKESDFRTGFSKVITKNIFDKYFSCDINYDTSFESSVSIETSLFDLYFTYIKRELIRHEDFIRHKNEKSKYFLI